ncbi:gliding motility-associated C-terminal domain-containing protein [Chitinophaga sp. GbtcB8]|uniref:gliding motility-associated C-terminal domain-containing protein n=1 Tax=Chitinophaga sp. GbtcB8 TaxID=2824753 RepID=UPI001C301C1C|nr:gliding motility-associated C-terminal domain-containing protein [Chitinophaga sp. GbtcB8]
MQFVFRITMILSLILCVNLAKADTFIVTTKADSGPGTLRDAINKANANGTASTDYIHFNLPGTTLDDRTIRINAELPALSSNIIVDGTTQPGAAFGVSNAKVKVLKDNYHSTGNFYNMFSIRNADNVSIYGMHIEVTDGFSNGAYCIYIAKSSNINIGASGKGNVLNASDAIIASDVELEFGSTTDLHIAYNMLGVNPDGVTVPVYPIGYSRIILWGAGDIEMDHNVINSQIRIEETFNTLAPLGKRSYKVHDNIGGGDYTGDRKIGYLSCTITTYPRLDISGDNIIEIKNNHVLSGRFALGGGQGIITVQGNKINTDRTGTVRTGQASDYSIEIYGTQKALVGGDLPAEKNYISGQYGGIICNYDDHVTITKNSIFCNGKGIKSKETVFVTAFNGSTVSGTSEPDAVIEVFDADNCSGTQEGCEGKVYLGRTVANANGEWSYTGTLPGNVVVTGTNKEGSTSEFTRATISSDWLEVTPACCGKPGSIKGITITGAVVVQWEDESGNVVSHDVNPAALPPGKYTLYANSSNNPHGVCAVTHYALTIMDIRPLITTEQIVIIRPCHDNNGSISNVTDHVNVYTKSYKWLNENDEVVGTAANLTNVPAGTYRLFAYCTDDCFAVSDPIILTDQPAPAINVSAMTVLQATCDNSNGAVNGITVTGQAPYTFRWLDEQFNVAGDQLSLQNVTPGQYRLELTDNSGCAPVTSGPIKIEGTGSITLDASNVLVTPAGCGAQGGAVKGILVTAADTYTWRNQAGDVVGNSLDLTDAAVGTYQLTAANNFSCSAQSEWYTINTTQPVQWSVSGEVRFPTCNDSDGELLVNSITGNDIRSLKWTNTLTNAVIGTTKDVQHVGPGSYALYIKDMNDCEQLAYTLEIPQRTPPVLTSAPVITDETCGMANGSISAPAISGEAPFLYRWMDNTGLAIGTAPALKGIGKGEYTLQVTDKFGCAANPDVATVNNVTAVIPVPQDLHYTIAKGQAVELKWTYDSPVLYTLYADAGLGNQLSRNNTGAFTLPTLAADATYYMIVSMDICTSEAAKAYITVVDKTEVYIPTAFTPNGDGQNDVFRPRYVGIASIEYFKVYNRWGSMVFSSNTLGAGWDGERMPIGSYYYVISGKDLLGKVFFKQGSILLIR